MCFQSIMKYFIFLLIIFSFLSFNTYSKKENHDNTLQDHFISPPDSIPIAVYWYWLSDNISKEGVIKDLYAMKKAGINRAFIGNIKEANIPYGNTKLFSNEWWEIMRTALKTATELGIEIGIFNSPGWSQSGGPWIHPKQSMRYLASASINVSGPTDSIITLPQISESQNIKVLAYPIVSENVKTWNIEKEERKNLELELNIPFRDIHTLIFRTQEPAKGIARLYLKKGNTYSLLKTFQIDRSNPRINVGFSPYAPIYIALPEAEGNQYKLTIEGDKGLKGSITLSTKPYIERYPEKSLAKMFQYPLPLWHNYLWEEQPATKDSNLIIRPEQIIDLTSQILPDGKLKWKVPAGKWRITRYAMKTTGQTNSPATPEGTGLEVDKMSKTHVKYHFDMFIGKILQRIPEEERKCLKIVVMDSYETGGLNWTDDMIMRFKESYAYDPIPYLPVLNGEVIGSPDISNRFLWDLRRLIADRIAYDYVGGLSEISHKHGLTTWLENYGHWGFPGEFLQYGGQSDEVAGEFWSEGTLGDIENKAASSCAHIYGKKHVWAESCTAGGKAFARSPQNMKQRIDRFFTEGINSTLLHVYIHQPEDGKPGTNAQFGNEFNRNNTWFGQIDTFIQYLKRCNLMLQQGNYVADIAYFIGEDTPKMTGTTTPPVPRGYSFDYINAEVLLNHAYASNGYLKLRNGMKYKILVLPQLKTMRPEVLYKIKELVHDGITILGPAPQYSPSLKDYPNADKLVATMSQELFGKEENQAHAFGKGKVYHGNFKLETALHECAVLPDMISESNKPVLFIHRQTDTEDIYFISNQSKEKISFSPEFRINGKLPELWNPLTAEIKESCNYTQTSKGTTIIPLTLEALESTFVIFCKQTKAESRHQASLREETLMCLNKDWSVTFHSDTTSRTIWLNQLKDWKDFEDQYIRYFSGTATYKTTFTINVPPDKSIYIDFGSVMTMGKVRLNNRYIGGVWTNPYKLPITDNIKNGTNILEIEVVNNWINHIIGDLNLPPQKRTMKLDINPWTKDSPLQSSGLLGPVKIIVLK